MAETLQATILNRCYYNNLQLFALLCNTRFHAITCTEKFQIDLLITDTWRSKENIKFCSKIRNQCELKKQDFNHTGNYSEKSQQSFAA